MRVSLCTRARPPLCYQSTATYNKNDTGRPRTAYRSIALCTVFTVHGVDTRCSPVAVRSGRWQSVSRAGEFETSRRTNKTCPGTGLFFEIWFYTTLPPLPSLQFWIVMSHAICPEIVFNRVFYKLQILYVSICFHNYAPIIIIIIVFTPYARNVFVHLDVKLFSLDVYLRFNLLLHSNCFPRFEMTITFRFSSSFSRHRDKTV